MDRKPVTVWDQAKAMMDDPLGAPALIRESMQGPKPVSEEAAGWSSEDGFFIVDRAGTVRLARVGRMAGVPSKAEIEQTLRNLDS
jgi:hypothetical protein